MRPMTAPRPPLAAIADDNEYLAELVEARFRAKRWRTLRIADGSQVIRRVSAEGASVLVLDVELPGLSGLEILRRLRADPRTLRLPVVMLTGRRAASDVETARALGAAAYVLKPFDLEALTRRVERCLEGELLEKPLKPPIDVD